MHQQRRFRTMGMDDVGLHVVDDVKQLPQEKWIISCWVRSGFNKSDAVMKPMFIDSVSEQKCSDFITFAQLIRQVNTCSFSPAPLFGSHELEYVHTG